MKDTTLRKINIGALTLFARKGLAIKVDEIGIACGISKGLMYNHYHSKDALVADLIQTAGAECNQMLVDCAAMEETAAGKFHRISEFVCRIVSDVSHEIDYPLFMLQARLSGFKIPDGDWYSTDTPNVVLTIAQIITQGQNEGTVVAGDPKQLAFAYWAAIQGLCCYAATGIPVSPEPMWLNRIVLKEIFKN
jgi:AcrR family transcriptional regulator